MEEEIVNMYKKGYEIEYIINYVLQMKKIDKLCEKFAVSNKAN